MTDLSLLLPDFALIALGYLICRYTGLDRPVWDGAERLVYGHMGGESLVIRTDEGDAFPALGSTIHVTPKAGRLHWFDTATGQRLP